MAEIDVTVNGHSYRIACEDGEEAHLMQLAEHIDRHAQGLAKSLGQVGEARLMLMAGLLVGDELSESLDRIEELQREITEIQEARARDSGPESATSRALETAARRIEALAGRLKSA